MQLPSSPTRSLLQPHLLSLPLIIILFCSIIFPLYSSSICLNLVIHLKIPFHTSKNKQTTIITCAICLIIIILSNIIIHIETNNRLLLPRQQYCNHHSFSIIQSSSKYCNSIYEYSSFFRTTNKTNYIAMCIASRLIKYPIEKMTFIIIESILNE